MRNRTCTSTNYNYMYHYTYLKGDWLADVGTAQIYLLPKMSCLTHFNKVLRGCSWVLSLRNKFTIIQPSKAARYGL